MGGETQNENISELRQDLVTGDWVVIATARAKRPDEFRAQNRDVHVNSEDPFLDPEASGQEKDVLIYRHENNDWSLRVFPNKFPAFARGKVAKSLDQGPYRALSGVGYHEVIVLKDPALTLPHLEQWRVAELLDAYQERYLDLMNKKTITAIQIFHNHGKEAGASQTHPHSQLMATPVIDPDMTKEITGAERYWRQHKKHVFSVILEYEQAAQKRVVYENEHFLAFCPYASKAAFEVRILPKRDNAYFERITDEEKYACAETLQKVLGALESGLDDPAFNYYIRTAPCDGQTYESYRWYIEIVPRTAIWAGFELSSGIEISSVPPEDAAAFLRSTIEAV